MSARRLFGRFGFGLQIHNALGELRQRLVGFLFLVERLLEQLGGLPQAELLRLRHECAEPADLIVLDRLGCSNRHRGQGIPWTP